MPQAPPPPMPQAPPPSSVLSMGLRDSATPGHMNATIAVPLPPQNLPPPPAPQPMHPSYPPPMQHSSSYGPPPPAQGPSWQPPAPVYPSVPPAPQPRKGGFPWLIVGMMLIVLLGVAAGLTALFLMRG
jgi:hypothetical protein